MQALQHLRYFEVFQTVMRTGNLTEAARLHNVSQPAVSHAVKELEQQLGIKLFSRSGGRVRPTAEAQKLLPVVERLFAHIGDFSFRVSQIRDSQGGRITVTSVSSLAGGVLPRAFAAFRRRHPRVYLTLLVSTVHEVMAEVKAERAELGFAFSPIDETGLTSAALLETSLVAVLPAAHPLAQRRAVTPPDLLGEVVILPTRRTVPGQVLRGLLDDMRVQFGETIEVNSASAGVALVSEGLGVAVVDPLTAATSLPPRLVLRGFEPAVPVTMAAVFSQHRPLPSIAAEFLAHVHRYAAIEARALAALGIPSSAPPLRLPRRREERAGEP